MFNDLPAGKYTIFCEAPEGIQQIDVALAEGRAVTGVDVALEWLGEVVGRIVDARTHAPIAGIRVSGG